MAERPKAVLVAVKLPDVDDAEFTASLAELERLVSTLGFETVAKVTQARQHFAAAAVIGEGKLEDLAELTGGTGHVGTTAPKPKDKARLKRAAAEKDGEDDDDEKEGDGEKKVALVALDHDISPSQLRNLERATGVDVLDRTGVIIDIFHRHAKSREARLQVEIARLAYTAPRLRESPTGKERQHGRGSGEAALELDRRKIRDRIAELKEELAAIQAVQGVRRAHDMVWAPGVTWADVYEDNERQFSKYNYEVADPAMLARHFDDHETEAGRCLEAGIPLAAYDHVLKCSHLFNLLDSRRAIAVTDRQAYILRMRSLSMRVARAHLENRQEPAPVDA